MLRELRCEGLHRIGAHAEAFAVLYQPSWEAPNPFRDTGGGLCAIYTWVWENPRPADEIAQIDFIGAGTGPALAVFGITVGDPPE